jgi:hypothetical protein
MEARCLPVHRAAYDSRNDVLEILLEGPDHFVPHPRELYVDCGPGGVDSLGILD